MDLATGLGLCFLSAVFNGFLGLPLRLRRRFKVENTWTLGNMFAMIVFPLAAAHFIFPTWTSIFDTSGRGLFLVLLALGFGWGLGSVAYSIGVSTIGLGIGVATIMGTIMAVGAGIPLLRRWSQLPGDARALALLGMVVAILGVALIGWSGVLRERGLEPKSEETDNSGTSADMPVRVYLIGLAWCIFSGLTSACANLGFDFAAPVAVAAVNLGVGEVFAALFQWMPLFWGAYLAILIFSGSTLIRKKTWRNFAGAGAGPDSALALFLGVCHFGTIMSYAMGAVYIGELGTSIGYAVALSMGLIIANLLGFTTAEWKEAPKPALRTLFGGLTTLIIAIFILAASGLV